MNLRQIFRVWPGMVWATALVALLLVQVDVVRLIFGVLFCLFVPGYGWARRMRSLDAAADRGDVMTMGVVLSICATVAVGSAMAVTGLWSPPIGFGILVVISIAGLHPPRRTSATHKRSNSVVGTLSHRIRWLLDTHGQPRGREPTQ